MLVADRFHLTYCFNIHPGESWEEVRANLERHIPGIRAEASGEAPFGIGLRLSAQAAETLSDPEVLQEFQAFLAAQNAYVFTLNGFSYGVFHHARVKEEVYLPDWKDEERLRYTNQLASILAALLPDTPGLEGSISTVPGAFKSQVSSEEDQRRMARLMLRHVAELVRIRAETGKVLTLALEPEPCCHLGNVDESVRFFRDFLHDPELVDELAEAADLSFNEADEAVETHLGLCYDACHMAMGFEDTARALEEIRDARIKICKFQISSALKLHFQRGDGTPEEILRPFAESTDLHQVVEFCEGAIERFQDLSEPLEREISLEMASRVGEPVEWRVHLHVPIFLEEMHPFQTTQEELRELLDTLREDSPCPYLEVETHTWNVLPEEYKTGDIGSDIVRELAWVREQLEG